MWQNGKLRRPRPNVTLWYTQWVLRRGFIFVVALSIAALAPLPLSTCALLASLPGDCTCPTPPSRCDHMGMAETQPALAGHSDRSCCRVTAEPLPEAQSKAPAPLDSGVPAIVVSRVPVIRPCEYSQLVEVFPEHSPPDQQPLLCVFLI